MQNVTQRMGGPRITVVIPTFRRPRTLEAGLASLEQQTDPPEEVIVVDNAADPAIERLVADRNRGARVPVRYIAEPRTGVHYARNTAATASRGDVLLYTDDDVTFDPGWVAAYRRVFAARPGLAVAGGPVVPRWDEEPPGWLVEFLALPGHGGLLSILAPRGTDVVATEATGIYSCNMAIERSRLIQRGGFHPEATGHRWLGDGESGLLAEMEAAGDELAHVPAALVHHHIPPHRMTVDYLRHRTANDGAGFEFAHFRRTGLPGSFGLACRIASIGLAIARLAIVTPLHTWLRDDRFGWLKGRLKLAFHLQRIRYDLEAWRDPALRSLITRRDWFHEQAVEGCSGTIARV